MNYIRIWDRTSSDRVDYYIANSKNVAKRIYKHYGIEADVIHPPVKGSYFNISDVDEDYFLFRVHLYENQYVLAFPKFGTIGIGFAQEEDWNTNLPYTCETMKIYNHIKHNKKYKEIKRSEVLKAIELLQVASAVYMEVEVK